MTPEDRKAVESALDAVVLANARPYTEERHRKIKREAERRKRRFLDDFKRHQLPSCELEYFLETAMIDNDEDFDEMHSLLEEWEEAKEKALARPMAAFVKKHRVFLDAPMTRYFTRHMEDSVK